MWFRKRRVAIVIVCLLPGLMMLAYSKSLLRCGIGAVSFWWDDDYDNEITHEVTSFNRSVELIVNAERFTLQSLTTDSNVILLEIAGSDAGILFESTRISDENFTQIGPYPSGSPSGWVQEQQFLINITWSGVDTNVTVRYYTESVWHSDGTVCSELPGFQESLLSTVCLIIAGSASIPLFDARLRQTKETQDESRVRIIFSNEMHTTLIVLVSAIIGIIWSFLILLPTHMAPFEVFPYFLPYIVLGVIGLP